MSQRGSANFGAISGSSGEATLAVENVGGIESCEIRIEPGCTVLSGENATNRTSVLRALGGVLGGTSATLKSDAESATVALTIGDETYERTYSREDGTTGVDGTPFTDAETLVDLFVTVLEDNPIRRAVERGEDLHDVLMRPIDTAAIERRLAEKRRERDHLDERIERVADRRAELADLESRRTSLEAEIDEVDEELDSLRSSLDELDELSRDDGDDLVQTIEDRQQTLASKEHRRDTVDVEIERLEAEIDDLTPIESDEEDLEEELERVEETLRSQRSTVQTIDDQIHSLTTIVSFNEDMLADDRQALPGVESDDVTAELGPESMQSVVCWTCGTTVNRGAISDRLDDLRSIVAEKRSQRDDVQTQVRELERQQRRLQERIESRRDSERELARLEAEADDARERRDRLTSEISSLRSEIDRLREQAETDDALADSEALERFEAINDLEYDRGQLEQRLADVESEIESIESLPEVAALRDEREAVAADIERLRTRIATVEDEAVESFNEHVAEVLEILGYENIARVWIEKKVSGTDTDRSVRFDLHIVRESADGTVYDDLVDHLSESEREVVGLLAALAGYLAHDVHEEVPFILLDSLEPLDEGRLSKLIDYFDEHVPYLVVALLTEDANALEGDYREVPAEQLSR